MSNELVVIGADMNGHKSWCMKNMKVLGVILDISVVIKMGKD